MVKTPEPITYWVPDLDLTQDDQQALEGDHWLSNRHISAVNTLLRQQHPGQNGLQDTLELSKNLKWRSNSVDFVQIVHVSQNHWVCVSNILSPPDIVEVFDSLPATFSSTLKRQVAAVLRCRGPQFTLCYIDVQHQNGADDCALFAVAFAEALCAGKDPHLLTFDQLQMRQHLQFCLEQGTVTNFPAATTPRRLHRTRVKVSRNVRVYCKCRLPWDRQSCQELGSLVQCSECKEWYHQFCLDVPELVFQERTSVWSCDNCK